MRWSLRFVGDKFGWLKVQVPLSRSSGRTMSWVAMTYQERLMNM